MASLEAKDKRPTKDQVASKQPQPDPNEHPIFTSGINRAQAPSMTLFDKKMVRRCGVWQIKRMTSQDQDQMSMKSNMFGFGGYSQMRF